MKFSNIVVFMILLLVISACEDSSKPSDSDAKKSVEKMYSDCKYLSVSNFEKVNGTSEGDNKYKVDVKYSLNIVPPPDAAAQQSKYDDLVVAESVKLQEANVLAGKSDEADKKANTTHASEDLSASWKLSDELKKAQQELNAITTEKNNLAGNSVNRFMSPSCVNQLNDHVRNAIYTEAGNLQKDNPNKIPFLVAFTLDFTGSIPMVKTDNGWQ